MVPGPFPSYHITKRAQGFRKRIWFPLSDKHTRRHGVSFFSDGKRQRMRTVFPIGPTSVGSSARKKMQLRIYHVILNIGRCTKDAYRKKVTQNI